MSGDNDKIVKLHDGNACDIVHENLCASAGIPVHDDMDASPCECREPLWQGLWGRRLLVVTAWTDFAIMWLDY